MIVSKRQRDREKGSDTERPLFQTVLDCQFLSTNGKNRQDSRWSISYALLTNKKGRKEELRA